MANSNRKTTSYKKTSYGGNFVNLTKKVYVRVALLLIVIAGALAFLVQSSQPSITHTATVSDYKTAVTGLPSLKPGDVNGDGVVNEEDIRMVVDNWGTKNASEDLNHNGIVNQEDIQIVLNNWGK